MHLNHRRGETRTSVRQDRHPGYSGPKTDFKKSTNTLLRRISKRVLQNALRKDSDFEDFLLPLANEVDNWWNYD